MLLFFNFCLVSSGVPNHCFRDPRYSLGNHQVLHTKSLKSNYSSKFEKFTSISTLKLLKLVRHPWIFNWLCILHLNFFMICLTHFLVWSPPLDSALYKLQCENFYLSKSDQTSRRHFKCVLTLFVVEFVNIFRPSFKICPVPNSSEGQMSKSFNQSFSLTTSSNILQAVATTLFTRYLFTRLVLEKFLE